MKVKVWADHESMSQQARGFMTREFLRNPGLLLCLATGFTPARTYELLGQAAQLSRAWFSELRVLKLDEWGGLPLDDPGSCESYLRERVLLPWRVSRLRYSGFGRDARGPEWECQRIQRWLARHGAIDLCVLGLGRNGHIGFNEPAAALCPVAHQATLSEETRAHPMVSQAKVKPSYGLTLGMGEILESRKILLLVSGSHKREPLRRLLRGEISTGFPASFLCLHPQVTVYCDQAAAPPGEKESKQ